MVISILTLSSVFVYAKVYVDEDFEQFTDGDDIFFGDDDDFDITKDSRVKEKHNTSVDGVEIILAHVEPGFGPWAVFPASRGATDPGSFHFKTISGIIVCGHAHMPKVVDRGGYIFINPGSPTFPSYNYELGTVALLTVNDGKAEVQFVQLQGKITGVAGSKVVR